MQIAVTESLARMVTKSERKRRSPLWFPSEFISDAFLAIEDQQFDSVRYYSLEVLKLFVHVSYINSSDFFLSISSGHIHIKECTFDNVCVLAL